MLDRITFALVCLLLAVPSGMRAYGFRFNARFNTWEGFIFCKIGRALCLSLLIFRCLGSPGQSLPQPGLIASFSGCKESDDLALRALPRKSAVCVLVAFQGIAAKEPQTGRKSTNALITYYRKMKE